MIMLLYNIIIVNADPAERRRSMKVAHEATNVLTVFCKNAIGKNFL